MVSAVVLLVIGVGVGVGGTAMRGVLSLVHKLLVRSLAIVVAVGSDVLAVGVVGLEVADLIMVLIIIINLHLLVVKTHGRKLILRGFGIGVLFSSGVVGVPVILTRSRRVIHII